MSAARFHEAVHEIVDKPFDDCTAEELVTVFAALPPARDVRGRAALDQAFAALVEARRCGCKRFGNVADGDISRVRVIHSCGRGGVE